MAALHDSTATPKSLVTVEDVIARMRRIEAALDPDDSVARFHRLYLRTTEGVAEALAGGAFENPPFIARLDVLFAQLYFEAFDADERGDARKVPRAWRPLFRLRAAGAAPLRFAMAGMNAHINYDLAQAVVSACAERGAPPTWESAEHRDYLRINPILAAVAERVRADFAGGPTGDAAPAFDVFRARDAAWANAHALYSLRELPEARRAFLGSLDRFVGIAGRDLILGAPNS